MALRNLPASGSQLGAGPSMRDNSSLVLWRFDMRLWTTCVLFLLIGLSIRGQVQSPSVQQIDLAERLAAGKLRAVNRDVKPLEGNPKGVHVNARPGPGVVWVDGVDFAQGTIEVDLRGRDVFQQSFVGIAFRGKDDQTYEAVYVRPFNFRADDPERHRHAVQYISVPDYDWPRLRKEFPDRFENAVDPAVAPVDWVPLRVLATGSTIEVTVGNVKSTTLAARKLGQQERGMVGLWTGNNSDGDFANLRISAVR
jgi:hypothetical protein